MCFRGDTRVSQNNVADNFECVTVCLIFFPHFQLRLKVHDSLLPQEDDEVEQRRNELEEKKKIYQFEWSDSDLMPMSKGIPSDEEFTEQYAVSSVDAREVNKNNLLGGQFLIFFAQ